LTKRKKNGRFAPFPVFLPFTVFVQQRLDLVGEPFELLAQSKLNGKVIGWAICDDRAQLEAAFAKLVAE